MTDILTDVNFAEHNSVPVPANAGKTAALADPSFNTSSESVGQASTVSTVVHAQEPMSTAASQRNSVVTLASPSGSRTRKLTTSQIWPQAREQNEKAVAFVARLQVWKTLLDDVLSFAVAYRGIHEHLGKEFQRLGKSLAAHAPLDAKAAAAKKNGPELVSNIAAWNSVSSVPNQMAVKQVQHGKALAKTVKELTDLRVLYARQFKHFSSETDRLCKAMAKERMGMQQQLDKMSRTLELVQRSSSDDAIEDPWLTKRHMDRSIETLVTHENKFQEELVRIQTEVMAFDGQIAQTLHKIYGEFINEENLVALKNSSRTIDSQGEFRAYCQKNELLNAPCFHQPRSYADFASVYSVHEQKNEIAKEAILCRQGNYRKSAFKPCLFVLTVSGFLHCFPIRNSKDTMDQIKADTDNIKYSVYLRIPKITVEPIELNVHCFEITVPNTHRGFFGAATLTYVIKCASEAEKKEWMEAIGSFLARNREPPTTEIAQVQDMCEKISA